MTATDQDWKRNCCRNFSRSQFNENGSHPYLQLLNDRSTYETEFFAAAAAAAAVGDGDNKKT